MTQVIVDPELRSKLNGLSEEVDFLDESGRRLGRFLPTAQYRAFLNALSKAIFTEEELKKAEQETGGRPLSEIWKSLGRT
ncbi:MAG TPA: hypothetical protein VGX70_14950 [Gemmataceae bacterium]|jgi:hypothetical protein|nr:hypothetical protein [Gemmataceae bacterium]